MSYMSDELNMDFDPESLSARVDDFQKKLNAYEKAKLGWFRPKRSATLSPRVISCKWVPISGGMSVEEITTIKNGVFCVNFGLIMPTEIVNAPELTPEEEAIVNRMVERLKASKL